MESKFYTLLGFAQKAGAVVSGETGALAAIARGKARLVVVAADASENSRERFIQACKSKGAGCVVTGSKAELGRSIGRPDRSVVVITDKGFSTSILSAMGERSPM